MLINYFPRPHGWETDSLLVCGWTSFNTSYWYLLATPLGLRANDNLLLVSRGGDESMVFNWCFNFGRRTCFPRKNRVFCFVRVYSAFFRLDHYLSDKTFENGHVYLNLLFTPLRTQ